MVRDASTDFQLLITNAEEEKFFCQCYALRGQAIQIQDPHTHWPRGWFLTYKSITTKKTLPGKLKRVINLETRQFCTNTNETIGNLHTDIHHDQTNVLSNLKVMIEQEIRSCDGAHFSGWWHWCCTVSSTHTYDFQVFK